MAKSGRSSWQSRSCSAWRFDCQYDSLIWPCMEHRRVATLRQKAPDKHRETPRDTLVPSKRPKTHPPASKDDPMFPLPPRRRGNSRRDLWDHLPGRIINLDVQEHPDRFVPGLGQKLEHVGQPAHVLSRLLERLQSAEVLPITVANRLVHAVAPLEVLVLWGEEGDITSEGQAFCGMGCL